MTAPVVLMFLLLLQWFVELVLVSAEDPQHYDGLVPVVSSARLGS
jgi:hypothetical protein